MKKLTIFLAVMFCVVLAGCDAPAEPTGSAPVESSAATAVPTAPAMDTPAVSPADEQTATLYIGTKAAGFAEYPMAYEGALTAELLIQGISDLTGWNLTLAEPVISGKGGMSVCLSSESALFVGPPDPQKDEFHMYSGEQLAETVLDSIQKTLQMGFTGEGGNPDALDIWYYLEGEQPLSLPELGLSWPLDQPYQWESANRQ